MTSPPTARPGSPRSTPRSRSRSTAPAGDAKKVPALAGWDDKNGFFLRSADDQFLLRITGQVQSDYRYYLNDHDAVDLPNFLVRRARLGIEATVFGHYDFRLLPDFGQGNTRLQDAYLNARWWDEFQFEAGKFKQPFSYEQLIQDRFVPTLERSMIDQLVPARDVGLMAHGYKLFDDRFDYQASIYGGNINGDQDTDKNKEAAGRVVVRPVAGVGAAGLGRAVAARDRRDVRERPRRPEPDDPADPGRRARGSSSARPSGRTAPGPGGARSSSTSTARSGSRPSTSERARSCGPRPAAGRRPAW